jgi:hypothetical protein
MNHEKKLAKPPYSDRKHRSRVVRHEREKLWIVKLVKQAFRPPAGLIMHAIQFKHAQRHLAYRLKAQWRSILCGSLCCIENDHRRRSHGSRLQWRLGVLPQGVLHCNPQSNNTRTTIKRQPEMGWQPNDSYECWRFRWISEIHEFGVESREKLGKKTITIW